MSASPERIWTVLELLRWTTDHFASRGIETSRLDAEILLASALECDRLRLYVDFEKPVQDAERARFRELVLRRAGERVPVALLLGQKEFWSLSLRVTSDVLVPRPETETLVQAALDAFPDAEAEIEVLDVGTGSGAVALAIASERPKARVTASDISGSALEVARDNAERLGLADRVRFLEGSLFEPLENAEVFDLVVSNPPYVAEREREGLPPELAHEPAQALFAGADGTDVLRPLVAGVGAHLRASGTAAFEMDPRQTEIAAEWLRASGFALVETRRDLARQPRVVVARL